MLQGFIFIFITPKFMTNFSPLSLSQPNHFLHNLQLHRYTIVKISEAAEQNDLKLVAGLKMNDIWQPKVPPSKTISKEYCCNL